MDLLEEASRSILTEESILEAVDEETLYCFYMDIEELSVHESYRCPFREDNRPSFGVFRSRASVCEYMWKDLGTGESGDIFELVKRIHNQTTRKDALRIIANDFGISSSGIIDRLWQEGNQHKHTSRRVLRPRMQVSSTKIRVKSIEFTEEGTRFWEDLRIGKDLLEKYNVTQISHYWSFEDQVVPMICVNPTFAYRVGKYYQIYSPNKTKSEKFRNDLPENYFFGYLQLPSTGATLIIDKSMKDVIFCRRLGLWAVAPKAEGIMIPKKKMLELKDKFNDVYIMLDNDKAGRKAMEKYREEYPWLKIRVLQEAKDKTDLCRLVGFEEARKIIYQTIGLTT